METKFPFTTWIYNPIEELSLDAIDMWKEVGFTHPMAPRIFKGNSPEMLKNEKRCQTYAKTW